MEQWQTAALKDKVGPSQLKWGGSDDPGALIGIQRTQAHYLNEMSHYL